MGPSSSNIHRPLGLDITEALDRLRAQQGTLTSEDELGAIDLLVAAVIADPEHIGPAVALEIDIEVQAWRLSFYGRDEVERAVRAGHSARLRRALIAMALAFNGARDWRDHLRLMPLPWRGAELLGEDPRALYLDVAVLPLGKGQRWVREFLDRRPEDRSVEVMGLREVHDGDGIRFEYDSR
jgi:hypothetical protein